MSAKTTKTVEAKNEATVTEEQVMTPAEEKKQEKKGNTVYLGPTITGVIKHSTVFQDGILPEKAQKCVSDFPMMRRLIVNIDEMADAVKELRKKQSALSTIYAQTEQKFSRR